VNTPESRSGPLKTAPATTWNSSAEELTPSVGGVVQSDDARCLRRLGYRLLLLAEAVEELEDGPRVAA
jgi:hypothetical protein